MIDFLLIFKHVLSLYCIIPLVLITGIYFSYKVKFLQFTKLQRAFSALIHTTKAEKQGVSSFAALAAVLGGNLGTGNIAGIAFGLATGGPGALFWMWVMAVFGSIVKYFGCFLGVKYRVKDMKIEGGNIGGPMYYLSKGLNLKVIAKLFCIFCIIGAFTVGILVQVNSVTLPLHASGINPLLSGIFMAAAVAWVLLGGKKLFLHVSAKVVPIMAFLYIIACFAILWRNYQELLPAIAKIFEYAFNPMAATGGIGGYLIFDAMKTGFDRGIFATDIGIGIAPILHSEVTTKQEINEAAFTQGMLGIVAPIIVMFICTITGLTLLVTNVWQDTSVQSTNMCIKAFQLGLGQSWAGYIVIVTIWLFAFTTILTWAHCSEKAFHYLFPKVSVFLYRAIVILFVPIGSFLAVSHVWLLADITINIMLLLNLVGIVGLSKEVIRETQRFL